MRFSTGKIYLAAVFLSGCILLSCKDIAQAADGSQENIFVRILKDTRFSSRIKVEYDDNIFLEENAEDPEIKQSYLQTINYQSTKGNHFTRLFYVGEFANYFSESTDVLSHSANVQYSYRPYNGFSFGIKNIFNWLEDNEITTTLGDRILDLGYMQYLPSAEFKYEIGPRDTVTTNVEFESLDVRDKDNDDFIDNRRLGVTSQIAHEFASLDHTEGFFGLEYGNIAFPQISEKSARTYRPFAGIEKTVPGVMIIRQEVGYQDVNMDDNADEEAVDALTSLETIFSLYTKLTLSFHYNAFKSSLRREFTQYASHIASLNLSHTVNEKVSLFFDYIFERQEFDASDITAGQSAVDRDTDIHKARLTLSQKLNSWLNMDYQYTYTKRNTDFALEGYTDNRFTVTLTARY